MSNGQQDLYEAIVLGINSDDLDIWAREVVKEKANSVKLEMEMKKMQKKGKGFFGRVFGKQDGQKSAAEQQEQMALIEKEIQEHASKMTLLAGSQFQRKNIPDVSFEFALNSINLTLINDFTDYKGVTLAAQNLSLNLNKYDTTNKYNPKSIEIDIALQNYGLWVVYKKPNSREIDYSPFMQKLLKEDQVPGFTKNAEVEQP